MLRGQIWLYRADPTVGDEIGKTRPCVIVSNISVIQKKRSHKPGFSVYFCSER